MLNRIGALDKPNSLDPRRVQFEPAQVAGVATKYG